MSSDAREWQLLDYVSADIITLATPAMADSNWKHRGTPAYFQVCSRIEDDDQRAGDNAHGYWI